jgi:hypothetical protein
MIIFADGTTDTIAMDSTEINPYASASVTALSNIPTHEMSVLSRPESKLRLLSPEFLESG